MVWTPKAGAPLHFQMRQAFSASILGDPDWAWLLPFATILSDKIETTAAFCGMGAPEHVPALSDLDFTGLIPTSGLGGAINAVYLAARLAAVAQERMFGQFCEQHVLTGVTCSHLANVAYGPLAAGNQTFLGTTMLPAGANRLRLRWITGNEASLRTQNFCYNAGGYLGEVGNMLVSPGTPTNEVVLIAGTDRVALNYASSGTNTGTAEVLSCVDGSFEDHTPTPQLEPPAALPPEARAYPDIAALGAELDRQEFKLDNILSIIEFIAANVAVPPVTTEAPTDAADGVKITPKAIGYVVAVSNIPAGANELFGEPRKFFKVARAAIGSVDGWLPSIEIDHTPFLIAPLPAGTDRIQVKVNPPATATIRALYPPK